MIKIFLITGGIGFIKSAVICYIILNTNHSVVNVDEITYAGNSAHADILLRKAHAY